MLLRIYVYMCTCTATYFDFIFLYFYLCLCLTTGDACTFDMRKFINSTYLLIAGSQQKLSNNVQSNTHTHAAFNGSFSRTTWVSWYQKGKTNLDFTEARDSEWQWHQLDNMQVCISLQTDNHASTPHRSVFLQAGCPSCHPTDSIKALKVLKVNSK